MINVIFIALCGILCGASGWDDLALFAQQRRNWLNRFLDLSGGLPSADTIRRVFEMLDTRQFQARLAEWVQSVARSFRNQVLACDGKALRGTVAPDSPTQPLHLLEIWSAAQGLMLGQRRVKGGSSEGTGLLELLPLLDIKGAILTADAANCTAEVTRSIRTQRAHYVLQIKGNRGRQHTFVKDLFEDIRNGKRPAPGTVFRTRETNRGRKERRTVWVVEPEQWPEAKREQWNGRRTAIMICRERTENGKTTKEWHYYISSMEPDPERLARCIRQHWSVENNLHWVLDVVLDEDERRIRNMESAENLATLSRFAVMLLKRANPAMSMAQKRKAAGWNDEFLQELIFPQNLAT